MKAKIIVTPKKAVLDPQGKTVANALEQMGYKGIGAVHVGKYLEIELPVGDPESWRKQLDKACHRILSNPVIEDYHLEIECMNFAVLQFPASNCDQDALHVVQNVSAIPAGCSGTRSIPSPASTP